MDSIQWNHWENFTFWWVHFLVQVWGADWWLAGSHSAWSKKTRTSTKEHTCRRCRNAQRTSQSTISESTRWSQVFQGYVELPLIKWAQCVFLWIWFWFWGWFPPARCASPIIDWWPQSRRNCAQSLYCLSRTTLSTQSQARTNVQNSIQHPSRLQQEGPQLIHYRDFMPCVEQNAQNARKPNTRETPAGKPSHNDASLRGACSRKPTSLLISQQTNSHLPIIEAFPTARSSRKPNPTYTLPEGRAKISQRVSEPQNPVITSNCERASTETDVMTMYGTARQDCNSLLSCRDTNRLPEIKVTTGQNFHVPSQPFRSPFRKRQHMLFPQRPRKQPNSKGFCHNAKSSARRQSTAHLHVSAVRANSSSPRQIWIHGPWWEKVLHSTCYDFFFLAPSTSHYSRTSCCKEGEGTTLLLRETILRTKYMQVLFHHADGGRIVLWYWFLTFGSLAGDLRSVLLKTFAPARCASLFIDWWPQNRRSI